MSWDYRIGHAEQVTLYDGGEVRAAVMAVLITVGEAADDARRRALEMWNSVNAGQRETCSLVLKDGRVLSLWDSSPAPQYDKQCNGYTSEGNRCGRYMNHPGEC